MAKKQVASLADVQAAYKANRKLGYFKNNALSKAVKENANK